MEIFNIAIQINDQKYASAMAEVLAKRYNFLHFTCHSKVDIDRKNKIFDVILSDNIECYSGNIICLTDSIDEESWQEYGLKKIFKYRSATRISRAIFDFIYEKTGHQILFRKDKGCKVIGFVGASVPDFSEAIISLAQVMKRNDEKQVLYICFNHICRFDFGLEDDEIQMMRMMYYLDMNKKFPIENFIYHSSDSIDYIADFNIPNILCTGSNKNISKIIRECIELGRYDYIFVDFGQNLISLIQESINKISDLIYLTASISSEMYESDIRIAREICASIGKDHFISIDEEDENFVLTANRFISNLEIQNEDNSLEWSE